MSVYTASTASRVELRPDPRWFALFVGLQAAALAAVFIFPARLLILGAAGIGAGLALVLLVLYPWLIVPAIMASTALDITGRLIPATIIGTPLTGFHLSLAVMLVAMAFNTCIRRRLQFPAFELAVPLALYLGIMAISLTYSPNQPEATIGFMRTVALVVFLYATQVMIDSRAAVHMVIASTALVMIGTSILGLVQIVTQRFYLPASFVIAVGANAPRAVGTFHNPNTFATFLMVGVVLLFALLVNCRMPWWVTLLVLGSMGIGFAGLVVTFSRANWLAGLVGIICVLYLGKKLRYLVAVGIAGFVFIVAARQWIPFADHIFLRFASIFLFFREFGALGRESATARVYFIMAGMHMWLDNPLLGAGWRAFPVLFDQYRPADFPYWVPTKESHTAFANIAAELGLAGLVTAAWIVWRTVIHGWRGLFQIADPYYRAVLIGVLSLFIAFQVSLSLTADINNNYLWFFTGFLFAVLRLGRASEPA